jgi:prevent-host-death family protein
MFLPEINSSLAQRDMKRLFRMAYKKPVLLTRQNKEDVVVMSKKHYEKLVKLTDKK